MRKALLTAAVIGMVTIPVAAAGATPPDNRPPADRGHGHGHGHGQGQSQNQQQNQQQDQDQCQALIIVLGSCSGGSGGTVLDLLPL